MLSELDPHSEYLPGRDFKELLQKALSLRMEAPFSCNKCLLRPHRPLSLALKPVERAMNIRTQLPEHSLKVFRCCALPLVMNGCLSLNSRFNTIPKMKEPHETDPFVDIEHHYGVLAAHLEEEAVIGYIRLIQQPQAGGDPTDVNKVRIDPMALQRVEVFGDISSPHGSREDFTVIRLVYHGKIYEHVADGVREHGLNGKGYGLADLFLVLDLLYGNSAGVPAMRAFEDSRAIISYKCLLRFH